MAFIPAVYTLYTPDEIGGFYVFETYLHLSHGDDTQNCIVNEDSFEMFFVFD